MNDPANPDNHWCYRVHFPIEELNSPMGAGLMQTVRELIRNNGR